MQRYLLRRLLESVVALFAISIIIFVIARMAPGDPTALLLPPNADVQERQAVIAKLGLDRPIHVQYWRFLSYSLRGDFGTSFQLARPVGELVADRLANTLQLTAVALVFATSVGLSMGILSAVKRDSFFDTFGKGMALMGQAAPSFWIGLMLILVFSVQLGWLPPSGQGGIKNLIMPTFTLSWLFVASLLRITRSAMLDVLDSDHIKMLRIKGVPERYIVLKHALRNAAIPIVTLMALQVSVLFRGSVLTETVFAWPGIGRLAVTAITSRDYPVVQATVIVGAGVYIVLNLLADIAYVYLNPRIRYN